mgnify:CR=1 FL=1
MKLDNITIDTMTVAEIVTENIRTADIFKKNGIDFCCGGNILTKDICEKKNVNYEQLKNDILNLNANSSSGHDFNSWDLDFMVDFIMNTHHKYVLSANELIIQYSDKVASVHGKEHPEVIRINQLFHTLVGELKMHMHKEEVILFPYIKQISEANKNNTQLIPGHFGSIQNPINMMEAEHDGAGDIIKEIKELTNNFTPPLDACNTYKALYSKLEEYQNDLFQHIHLENNILFPKAIKLEQLLLN